MRAPVSTLFPAPPSHMGSISSIQGPRDVVIATNSHRLADLGEGGQECWAAALPSSQAQSAQGTSIKAENCHRVPRYHENHFQDLYIAKHCHNPQR